MVGLTGSIRGAGDAMNVDHSSISRHIKSLEARLNITLFRQEGRRLLLTEEGTRYHRKLRRAFDIIAEATAELRIDTRRTMAIFAMPGIAHRLLLPRLPELHRLLPEWEISLMTGVDDPFDAPDALRIEVSFLDNPQSTSDRSYEMLAQPRMFPVANPKVRAAWLAVADPAELLDLPLIRSVTNGLWDPWFQANGIESLPPLRGPIMPNMHLAIEAAIYGQGISLVNEIVVRDVLLAGDLVEILETDIRFQGYYVSAPTSLWSSDAVVALRLWLKALLKTDSDGGASADRGVVR